MVVFPRPGLSYNLVLGSHQPGALTPIQWKASPFRMLLWYILDPRPTRSRLIANDPGASAVLYFVLDVEECVFSYLVWFSVTYLFVPQRCEACLALAACSAHPHRIRLLRECGAAFPRLLRPDLTS